MFPLFYIPHIYLKNLSIKIKIKWKVRVDKKYEILIVFEIFLDNLRVKRCLYKMSSEKWKGYAKYTSLFRRVLRVSRIYNLRGVY